MNRGTSDEGFICARGISTIRLRQSDAVRKDVESIRESLVHLFEKAEQGSTAEVRKLSDYDYKIVIQFAEASQMWKTVQEFVRTSTVSNGRLAPKIPSEIISGERIHLAKSFIQGYADVRSRISVTDREGVSGPLRISVSVSTYAGKFGREMAQLMRTTFGMKRIGLLEGGRRGRETMLRFDPAELPKGFFRLHWKRLLLEDFAKYNREHYPQRYVIGKQGRRRRGQSRVVA